MILSNPPCCISPVFIQRHYGPTKEKRLVQGRRAKGLEEKGPPSAIGSLFRLNLSFMFFQGTQTTIALYKDHGNYSMITKHKKQLELKEIKE